MIDEQTGPDVHETSFGSTAYPGKRACLVNQVNPVLGDLWAEVSTDDAGRKVGGNTGKTSSRNLTELPVGAAVLIRAPRYGGTGAGN